MCVQLNLDQNVSFLYTKKRCLALKIPKFKLTGQLRSQGPSFWHSDATQQRMRGIAMKKLQAT